MAGSIDNLLYTTDDAEQWIVTMDKSNARAINATPLPFPDVTNTSIPKDTIPRYLLYRDATGKQTRKIIGLDPAVRPSEYPASFVGVGMTPEGAPSLSVTFYKAFYHGERRSFALTGDDTGIQEPDA